MLGLRRGEVVLAAHDPSWRLEAIKACSRLKEALGEVLIEAEHVGSTSIDTIRAKPIIDIAAGVGSLAEVHPKIERMKEAGFIHKPENDAVWQVFFSSESQDGQVVTHHVHCVIHGGEEWENYLLFRDRLRNDPSQALEYEAMKEALLDKYANDRSSYTEGKASYIKAAIQSARSMPKP